MNERQLRKLEADVGELLAQHGKGAANYSRYRDDPVGFITNVLGGKLYPKQVEVAGAVRDHAQVTVRSCHAAGKDWLAARLALWWCYCRKGLAIITGPTAAQCEEIIMRKEIAQAFAAGDLPGDAFVRAVRPPGSGAAGVLTRTGSAVHALTGLHEARVLFIITEAQDPDISHAWDAAFACTTGTDDRILTLGNPTEIGGRFEAAHHPDSNWHRIRITADDVIPHRIPGLLTREGVERMIREYGADSPFVTSRVHAEFPSESTDSLVSALWIDRAAELHRTEHFWTAYRYGHYTLGVDPARLGPDNTVVCIRRANVVERFDRWSRLDTMETASRVEQLCRSLIADYEPGAQIGGGIESVHIDSIGIGAGVFDRLRQMLPEVRWASVDHTGVFPTMRIQSPQAYEFSAGRSAGIPERFANLRAQAYWQLRKLLEEGQIALPEHAQLREELLATRVRFTASGQTMIEEKTAIKQRLGRSPDYADALVISLGPLLEGKRQRRVRVA